jgi:3-dehydroquinate synthase
VVEGDPEARRARPANFGHTLPRARDRGRYRGLLHGDAVAWGMLFALRLSLARGLPEVEAARLRDLLRRLGPPPPPDVAAGDLVELMRRDKKARESGLDWILLERLGSGRLERGIGAGEVERSLAAFLADPWSVGGTATSL